MNTNRTTRRHWNPPRHADEDGLVGIGGDLRPQTLLLAYSDGVFPWFNEGMPILWWSPDPRGLIELDGGLHISRSLARTIRSGRFRTTLDHAFPSVMKGCGEQRTDGTWITDEMIEAYTRLHHVGHAHSVESWVRLDDPKVELPERIEIERDDAGVDWLLAGGIYGVSLAGLFAGESMFHRVTDASKVALAALYEHLQSRGYQLFDVQMENDHTSRLGATSIPRELYLKRLQSALRHREVTWK